MPCLHADTLDGTQCLDCGQSFTLTDCVNCEDSYSPEQPNATPEYCPECSRLFAVARPSNLLK